MSINYAPLAEIEKRLLPYFNPRYRSEALANIVHAEKTGTTFETIDQCLNFILPRGEFSGAYMPKDYQFRRLVKSYFEGVHDPTEIIRALKERLENTESDGDMLYPLSLVLKNRRPAVSQIRFLETLEMGEDITIYTRGRRLYIPGKDAHSIEEAAGKIGTDNKTRKGRWAYPLIDDTPCMPLNYEITGRLGFSITQIGRILQKHPRLKKYINRDIRGKRVVRESKLNKFMEEVRKTETYLSLLNKRGKNVNPPPVLP